MLGWGLRKQQWQSLGPAPLCLGGPLQPSGAKRARPCSRGCHDGDVKPSGTVRALSQALDEQQLVTIKRAIRRSDKLGGYVVGIGRQWALMELFNGDLFLNGYSAVRLDDVIGIAKVRPGLQRRALELFGEWPPSRPTGELSLDGTRELLISAGALFPLLTLFDERVDPEACYIGAVVNVTQRSVRLLEVTPNASWEATVKAYGLAKLTRVDFAGRYERALWGLAGPPPDGAVTVSIP